MAIKQSELENLLKEAFPNSEIEISDLAGDDNHFAAKICSSLFKGKNNSSIDFFLIEEIFNNLFFEKVLKKKRPVITIMKLNNIISGSTKKSNPKRPITTVSSAKNNNKTLTILLIARLIGDNPLIDFDLNSLITIRNSLKSIGFENLSKTITQEIMTSKILNL